MKIQLDLNAEDAIVLEATTLRSQEAATAYVLAISAQIDRLWPKRAQSAGYDAVVRELQKTK